MTKNKPSVSIVTINQKERNICLPILVDLIKQQDYKNIIEWIIVEGSSSLEKMQENKQFIEKNVLSLDPLCGKIKIRYIFNDTPLPLGNLRNISNDHTTGDIIVCMDDDDYYPPTRVSHAVKMLSGSTAEIAGCSPILIYDYLTGKQFHFKQLAPYHSTNNCFAYKKSYLKNNRYDDTKTFAEESSFTKHFKNPLIQLRPEDTMVLSVHTSNTFNKRRILTDCLIGTNDSLYELPSSQTLIPSRFLERYKKVFLEGLEKESTYDICYLTGGYSIDWDPESKSLGGSEQAVVYLSEEWVRQGKKVVVFGNVPNKTVNGVDYVEWQKLPLYQNFNIVILWRLSGLLLLCYDIKAKQIMLDVHDRTCNFQTFSDLWRKYKDRIHKVFFKSKYAVEQFVKENGELTKEKYVIIPNGVRIKEILESPYRHIQKNPYRFCYCSCYTRGLYETLRYIWPVIFSQEPRAELHVYYGMENIKDEKYKNELKILLSQPGVMDHGRQNADLVIREKYMSSFHLYLSFSPQEIDCISIKESLLTGAIPILSDFGVFKEREGIHIEYNPENSNTMKNVGLLVSRFFNETPQLEEMRKKFVYSPTLFTWERIALDWLICC